METKRMNENGIWLRSIAAGLMFTLIIGFFTISCNKELESTVVDDPLVQVAELSSQISSGTDITIIPTGESGSRSSRPDGVGGGRPEGASYGGRPEGGQYGGRPDGGGGMGFRQYNDDPKLLVLSIADRIGGRMSFGFFGSLGADIKHYDENGALVELDQSEKPAWGSWQDSDQPQITNTEIDFGDGIIIDRGTVSLSFKGVISIDRNYEDGLAETYTFENLSINDASIEGTMAVNRSFNQDIMEGNQASIITDGKITFADGTSADWVSTKTRAISITLEEGEEKPSNASSTTEGETVVTTSDGDVLYSHTISSPLKMDMSCNSHGRMPSSGTIETIYRENTISIDFGDGDCANSATITINGVSVTREVRGG